MNLASEQIAIDPTKHMPGVITWRQDLDADLWLIKVSTQSPLEFHPGQYATLSISPQINDGSKMIERPYSMVSAPHETELEFFLEKVSIGALTPHLYELNVGAQIYVRHKAKGLFLKNLPTDGKTTFLVCTVTGMAPFVSLVRHLIKEWKENGTEPASKIVVMQGASYEYEFGYYQEFVEYDEQIPWLIYIPTISRPTENPNWSGQSGRVNQLVRDHGEQLGITPGQASIHLCGNPAMITDVREFLVQQGFDDSDINEEQYWRED